MIAAALDVQRRQIEAGEGHVARFEQVIGHLARHELVQVLHGRHKEATQHLVHRLDLHQHLRVEESSAKLDRCLLLLTDTNSSSVLSQS